MHNIISMMFAEGACFKLLCCYRLVYEPDQGSEYWAWGSIEQVKSLLKTTLSSPELLSFLIFCVNDTAHSSHWLNVCIQHRFFGKDVPHYYRVNSQ
jgi:hypothetical protein